MKRELAFIIGVPLFMALGMGACSTTASRVTCPPLKEYSEKRIARIGQQIEAIRGQFPDLELFIVDATKLRDAARTCRARRDEQRGK